MNVMFFQKYLDNTLSYVFQGKESMLSEGFQAPKRAGANRSSEVLGTYAEMLKASVRPMATQGSNEKYNQPRRKTTKRTHYNLLDQSSFPSMENKHNDNEPSKNQPNGNYRNIPHQEQSNPHKETNLKEMEKSLEMTIEKKLMKRLDDMIHYQTSARIHGHLYSATKRKSTHSINTGITSLSTHGK